MNGCVFYLRLTKASLIVLIAPLHTSLLHISSADKMNRVELGWFSFRICWLCILVVHAAVAGFYMLVASAYLKMKGTTLAAFLSYYSIGMLSQY